MSHTTTHGIDKDYKEAAVDVVVQEVDTETTYGEAEAQDGEIDYAYLNSSWSTKTYRGTLFQMILFGA
jgi:hypothetical protein